MPREILTVPLGDLTEYHKNARQSDVQRIAASLRENGQYRPITVNEGTRTGRPMEVLAGNHVLQAARSLGWEQLDIVLVDVNDRAAARIVLADNKTSDDSTYDSRLLDELLAELQAEQDDWDLSGTGYDQEAVDEIALDASLQARKITTGPSAPEPTEQGTVARSGPSAVTYAYSLIFANADERATFERYVRWLRQTGTRETIGGLVAEHVEQVMDEAGV